MLFSAKVNHLIKCAFYTNTLVTRYPVLHAHWLTAPSLRIPRLGLRPHNNPMPRPASVFRQCSFIGQVNSVLYFFGKLSSEVKIRLFRSYCTSFYGCELWNLSCAQLADLCTKWRKSVRRVLNLPLQTHCYLLPLLCQCLPVYDEICGRTMNFVRSCLYHQSSVVAPVYSSSLGFRRTDWLNRLQPSQLRPNSIAYKQYVRYDRIV